MTTNLKEKVAAANRRMNFFAPGDRLLVAVSGGPDSVALLHLLLELREDLGLHLEVAHLQHGIRGGEAVDDARFVNALTQRLSLPFHLKEVDLPAQRRAAGKGNLESLGRERRYQFFAEVARAQGLNKIATAHTEDDQAETVLMWFLRGAGMKGLGGMAPIQEMPAAKRDGGAVPLLVRPLLSVSKSEVLGYLSDRRIGYRIDRTNQDETLLRNWIRLELLPKIHQRVDDRLKLRLRHQAELIRTEDKFLHELAQREFESIRTAEGLDRKLLMARPEALRRRILRLWIEQARGHLRGLDFVHIEALLGLIDGAAPQGRLAIPGGWELAREYDRLTLVGRAQALKVPCYNYPFEIGMIQEVPEARMALCGERVEAPVERLPASLDEAVFDVAGLAEKLFLRNFRHGDQIRPLGMTGHKKIKDIFIDRKVPLSIRASLPLLVMGTDILWVPGYARSELARVTARSRFVVRIKAISMGA